MTLKALWRVAIAAGLALPLIAGLAHAQGMHDPDADLFRPPSHRQGSPQPYQAPAQRHYPQPQPYYQPVPPYYPPVRPYYGPAVPYWGPGLFFGFEFGHDYRYGHRDYRRHHRYREDNRRRRHEDRDRDRDRRRDDREHRDRIRPGTHPDPDAARRGINPGDGQYWPRGKSGDYPTSR
jgi:hypothetical protein